ncbi:flavin reductase family protein [Falsirhodobacter sp. alg1]|uniref:flavin reductase family protein n=1 Tax=Falsirhodobacter sp. alg1 TaxID=1472418 RepID=UPI0005EE6331|nr:flavin reductase family protein [Falsirhodobacter sp. alg1]
MNGPASAIGTSSFVPAPDNGRMLRDVFGRFATGVTVVTTRGPDGCVAITANSFSSVSMDPPLVQWAPARSSSRFAAFTDALHFSIHILGAEQESLAYEVARDQRALLRHAMEVNDNDVPILQNCLARFDCARHAVHDAGDHAIVVGEVLRAQMREGLPLIFFQGKVSRLHSN